MSNKIEDLLNQLPKKVSVEQHYHDEQQKLIHNKEMEFTFGDKLEAIDFAKWLAQDWMSIWVGDKWMWECQTDGVYLGYKTEEELYQIYLNEN